MALALALISMGFLGGCSEARLMIHAAKKISGHDGVGGAYKVGSGSKIKGVWGYP